MAEYGQLVVKVLEGTEYALFWGFGRVSPLSDYYGYNVLRKQKHL